MKPSELIPGTMYWRAGDSDRVPLDMLYIGSLVHPLSGSTLHYFDGQRRGLINSELQDVYPTRIQALEALRDYFATQAIKLDDTLKILEST